MNDRPLCLEAFSPTRRQFTQAISLLTLYCLTGGCVEDPKTLNFFNWSLYIGPTTVKDF